jgi:hypothetical protein
VYVSGDEKPDDDPTEVVVDDGCRGMTMTPEDLKQVYIVFYI